MARQALGAKVWLALATVYVVWGSTYLGIDLAIRTIPPFVMAAARFLLAGGLLYAWAIRRSDRMDRPTARHWLSAFLIATPMLAIGNAAVGWAEETVDTGTASLIIASVPLWLALLDRALYGQRLARSAVTGLVVGFAAVGLLVGPGGGVGGRALVLVFTSLAWSAGSLYARQASQPQRPAVAVGMQMLAAGLVLTVFAAAKGEVGQVDVGAISLESWLGLLYLVVAGSLVAFTAYMWLLRNAPTSLVGTYAYVNPVVAVLLGTVFLGEPLGWRTLVGGAIIVASVALIVRAPKAKERPAPEPRRVAAPLPARGNLSDMTFFDLRNVRVRSGEEHREGVEVAIAPIELGGERYVAVPEQVPAELSVTRASTGVVLGLRLGVRLHGPCVRCLTDAVVDETLGLREYQATSPDSEELTTPYLVDDRIDLSAWARDALILALPDKILCRPDCAGLCPVCGRDLNAEPHVHEEEAGDPRWAALQQLKETL